MIHKINNTPRPQWENIIKSHGLTYSINNDENGKKYHYWNENHVYVVKDEYIDDIEIATKRIHEKIIDTIPFLIEENYDKNSPFFLGFNEKTLEYIKDSYKKYDNADYKQSNVIEKVNFSIDNDNKLHLHSTQLHDYNDLLESSIVQYLFLEELYPDNDQYNSISNNIVHAFANIKQSLPNNIMTFCLSNHNKNGKHLMNTYYLMDCAQQAGIKTKINSIEKIHVDESSLTIKDIDGNTIINSFFNYPVYETVKSDYIQLLISNDKTIENLYEPLWKSLLRDDITMKALQHLYQDEELLIDNKDIKTFDNNYPIINSWVIDNEPSGMAIKEKIGELNSMKEHFIPHILD